MQLQQNHIFASHYLLERLLGRGGFSEVWLAYDQTADVRVAIKVYAPGTGLDNDGVELFRKEFKIVFDMNHTNLLRPNYYSIEDNMPYLVMPYIERGSTTKMIGKMPETEVWKFIRDVAAGLAYLHAKEPPVIHQDIKPDNVMLMNDGTYVITDFGISTRARSTLRKSVNANASAGTQAYMGPERFGKQPAPIKASDVWSLGATVYELMEGDVPFGDFGGINQKSGAEIPDINGNYSDELKELVFACLCQETWDRPTAEQLSDYASDKIKGRNPVMPWKKKGPADHHEKPDGRETQFHPDAMKWGKSPKSESTKAETNPKRKLTWLWLILALALLGDGFTFYRNSKDKQRIEQEMQQSAERQRQIAAENERKAKEPARFVNRIFTVNGVSFEMVAVEGGTFIMGATAEQGEYDYDEKLTHSVTLSSYHMGETEVTQALWQAVMGSNPSYFSGSNLPVEQVSWNDCQEFITKLNQLCASQLNGKHFSLPTEAQWEYAARGGKSRGCKYSGSNTIEDVAWYDRNSGGKTHAVGTKQANELGLYDMSGNVREWCQDWYDSSYYSSSPQNNPAGPASGSRRVYRGGSWSSDARRCRVSYRYNYTPDYAYNYLGLRLSLR